MNGGAVITRESTQEKLFFNSELTFPRFSLLDPQTTYSLPERQTANGVVDAFVQVLEQYLTYDANTPLQDRFSEGILQTLLVEAPKLKADPRDYSARANVMWCATNGLNGLIGCGVPQDWASHMIGHELTALYGMDHGQTLAVVMPLVMRHQRRRKREKLLQFAARVWNLSDGSEDSRIDRAIARTEEFFRSLGVKTRLADYGVPPSAASQVADRLAQRKMQVGEHQDLGRNEVLEILSLPA
jgi:NADP-dependent alcohol dehydrogenase